jgi:hypothetical protein
MFSSATNPHPRKRGEKRKKLLFVWAGDLEEFVKTLYGPP